jgi:hypothetical protein
MGHSNGTHRRRIWEQGVVSNFYSGLSAEQITATYKLVNLLTRLRVIGQLTTRTVQTLPAVEILGNYDIIDMTMNVYGIEKVGYDPSKGRILAEELLESIFGRKATSLRGLP